MMVGPALGGRLLRGHADEMPRVKSEDGQAIVEYGMIIAGISLVMITFVIVGPLGAVFTSLVDNIEAAFS
jgi:Flp pilus assembly pilin Flp